jgi:hypothetical protein
VNDVRPVVVFVGPPTPALHAAARRLQRRGRTVEIVPPGVPVAVPRAPGGPVVVERVTWLFRIAPAWALRVRRARTRTGCPHQNTA